MKGIIVKIICTIALSAIYDFYYDGGDTIVYYNYILILKNLILTDPLRLISIAINPSDFYNVRWLVDNFWFDSGVFLYHSSTKNIILIGISLGILCGFSYVAISLLISYFAFLGCWKLFLTFSQLYPNIHRNLAIACLFIPSVCFWGSGLLKDPVCIGALGYLIHSTYLLIFKRVNIFKNIIVVVLSIFIVSTIKVYIMLSFLPALCFWIFARSRVNIKSQFIRTISTPLFILFIIFGTLVVLQLMASMADKYSFENMMRTAQDTQNSLVYSSQLAGSTSFYTLGDINYTPMGLLKVFPAAVNVSLFRPYIWEAKKPILMISSVEGIVTMGFTIFLLYKSGIWNTIKQILLNPDVLFCMVFSIIFAFAVGFTSFNFGALARYKIPFMPFYYIALFILADTSKKSTSTASPPKKR